ncbi:MAG: hypothetical protein H0W88_09560 [Parachlamydiaceae bacterium]|nr:hypothetical protein [Parachlamydiaceae bacterium]
MNTPISDYSSKGSTEENVKSSTIKLPQKTLPISLTETVKPFTTEMDKHHSIADLNLKHIELIKHHLDLEEQESSIIEKIELLNRNILKDKDNLILAKELTLAKQDLDKTLLELNNNQEALLLSRNKIDFPSLPSDQFIKKAIKLINSPPAAKLDPSEKHHLFTQAVHIALKGYAHPETYPIQKAYGGDSMIETSHLRAKYALDLLEKVISSSTPIPGIESEKEKEGLARICKACNNFNELCALFPTSGKENNYLISMIQQGINDLDNPHSPNVVELEDGATCFVIPGGWKEHYISYEIRKNKDGTYEFIIHNRGRHSDDERFHGNLSFAIGDKTYARTRVPIRVDKDVIQNSEFLNFLLTSKHEPKGSDVYDGIYKRLIVKGNGKILISENEEKLQRITLNYLYNESLSDEEKEKIKMMIQQLVKSDPNFHSQQLFGTCTESNWVTTLKEMAPKSVLKNLKLFRLMNMVDEMGLQYLSETRLNNMKTKNLQEIFKELLKKPMGVEAENALFALMDRMKDYTSYKASPESTKSDKETLKFDINRIMAVLNNKLQNPAFKVLLEELNIHVDKEIGHLRSLMLHLGIRKTQLSSKIQRPQKKQSPFSNEEIDSFINKLIKIDDFPKKTVESTDQPEKNDLGYTEDEIAF